MSSNPNPNEDTSKNTTVMDKRLMGNIVRMPVIIGEAFGSSMQDTCPVPPVSEWGKGKFGKMPDLMDYWGDEGVCSLGYNTPPVIKAITGFLATGAPHQLPDVYPHRIRWDAAEIICSKTGMDKIFFANSGTEAVEAAIKIARKFFWDKESEVTRDKHLGQRHKILTIEGNFHGRTGLSMAAGDCRVSPYHRHGFGPVAMGFGVLAAEYTTGFNTKESRVVGCSFKQVITDGKEHNPNWDADWDWSEVAAIILAPVLGNNLVKTYPRPFWEELARIREEHGVLLIYDDVQAGSGRGGHFATWQHPDIQVKPDIMTLGKGMAMGFPMSCMLARDGVAEAFTPGVHFNTFGGSPFVCWMAAAMFNWLEGNLTSVRAKGDTIRESFQQTNWIKEHDGYGMLNAFTPDFERYGYDGFQFCHAARVLGLSIVTHRRHGPIRFTPPLNAGISEITQALGVLEVTHMKLIAERK